MSIDVNDQSFKQEVLEESLPVMVDFWAAWCGPCLRFAPVVEQIADEYKGKLKVCKLNVDEAHDTAFTYKIMSIPTLAIFKKGKVIEQIVGALSKEELENVIQQHI